MKECLEAFMQISLITKLWKCKFCCYVVMNIKKIVEKMLNLIELVSFFKKIIKLNIIYVFLIAGKMCNVECVLLFVF